jgi:hypothetical protein
LPLGLLELDVLLADILVDFLDVSAIEWSQARKKLEGDDTQTPYIDLFVVLFMLDELWCHVEWGTKY